MYRYYINCENWNPTHDQWIGGTRCITKEELEAVNKFIFQRDAKFSLASKLLIRYVLSKAFQCKSSLFEIQRTEYGRPFIKTTKNFDFNVSHHNHLACIAATFDGNVGCDTMEYKTIKQKRQSIDELINLLRKELTNNEYDFVLNKTQDEKKRFAHFYRLWSLKESYVKWLGCGLGFTLSRLNFCINTDEFNQYNHEQILSNTILELDNKNQNDKLRFDEQIIYLDDNEQQIITLCLSNNHPIQPFIELTIDEVLKECTPIDENQSGEEKWWDSFQKKKT